MKNTGYYKVRPRYAQDYWLISLIDRECIKVEQSHWDYCVSHSVPDDVGYTTRHSGTDVKYSFVIIGDSIVKNKRERKFIPKEEYEKARELAITKRIITIDERYQSSADDDLGSVIRAEFNADTF